MAGMRWIFLVSSGSSRPQLWHERWLNLFGSLVGWVTGWLILVRHCGWPIQKCGGQPDGWDLIGGLVAFVGVTGYLPYTIVGLISGVHKLAGELIKKVLP
jgi:hypothetical protein